MKYQIVFQIVLKSIIIMYPIIKWKLESKNKKLLWHNKWAIHAIGSLLFYCLFFYCSVTPFSQGTGNLSTRLTLKFFQSGSCTRCRNWLCPLLSITYSVCLLKIFINLRCLCLRKNCVTFYHLKAFDSWLLPCTKISRFCTLLTACW